MFMFQFILWTIAISLSSIVVSEVVANIRKRHTNLTEDEIRKYYDKFKKEEEFKILPKGSRVIERKE